MKPPQAQEARLLSGAAEDEFESAGTSAATWAYQDAKRGRMFVVNRGKGFGFLRCTCGYATMLRNPAQGLEVRHGQHKTPHGENCEGFFGAVEDFAHEFRTDVLQVRVQRRPSPPADLSPVDQIAWAIRLERTLAEALRQAGTRVLNIQPGELSAATRNRVADRVEVVLYDSVPGGAGYCRMLVTRGCRALLDEAAKLLACRTDCTESCRACLRSYENQRIWDQLDRKPVLSWLTRLAV